MPRNIGATILKLLLASLGVGLLLSFFDLSPAALLAGLDDTAREVFDLVVGIVEWAVPYILIGAVVVVPVWLVFTLLRVLRRR